MQFPRQELVLLLSHFKKIRFGLFYLFYHSAIPDSPTPFCLFLLTLISQSSWERVEASCVFKFVVLFLCCFLVPPPSLPTFSPFPAPLHIRFMGPVLMFGSAALLYAHVSGRGRRRDVVLKNNGLQKMLYCHTDALCVLLKSECTGEPKELCLWIFNDEKAECWRSLLDRTSPFVEGPAHVIKAD